MVSCRCWLCCWLLFFLYTIFHQRCGASDRNASSAGRGSRSIPQCVPFCVLIVYVLVLLICFIFFICFSSFMVGLGYIYFYIYSVGRGIEEMQKRDRKEIDYGWFGGGCFDSILHIIYSVIISPLFHLHFHFLFHFHFHFCFHFLFHFSFFYIVLVISIFVNFALVQCISYYYIPLDFCWKSG